MHMKASLRDHMLTQRLALSQQERDAYALSLIEQVAHHPAFLHAKTVGLYHPIKHEPNLLPLMQRAPHHMFYLPKVFGSTMDFVAFDANTPLEKSALGIMEPILNTVYHTPLDLLIIPALAIDHQRHRLGYGKGFFDAYLTRLRPKHILAVIYPFQYVKALPVEGHDQQVDDVLIANLTSTHQ